LFHSRTSKMCGTRMNKRANLRVRGSRQL
jgi:hypothetical protein